MNVYPKVSLYAMMLAAAGIPLYIHLPRFASTELGIGLGTLGVILLLIRLIDLVQDPLLGWMIDRWPRLQMVFGLGALGGLAVGFPLLFSLHQGVGFGELIAVLVLLFSSYSLGMILLYGRSATLAHTPSAPELLRLAAYREGGMLAGVILAAAAPQVFVLMGAIDQGYPAFGLFLATLAVGVVVLTFPIWQRVPRPSARLSLRGLWQSGGTLLLTIALINGLPVAITSTLFLFYVEDHLNLPQLAGPFLILFFLSAGLSVPIWSALSRQIGARRALLISMPLAIVAFVGAGFLGSGNAVGFFLICLASGAALGGDMVLLPAMFSVALTRAGLNAASAFGFWSFAGKLGLALAAFIVLPLLEQVGYVPSANNSSTALGWLVASYALLPCLLKLGALALVLALPKKDVTL